MLERVKPSPPEAPQLGIGYYAVPEAARLLRMPGRTIRRWLGGDRFVSGSKAGRMPPLWAPELPANDDRLELSFRDLIELRFVNAFVAAGLDLCILRNCLDRARVAVQDPRPFSTRRFRTSGLTIFLDTLTVMGESAWLDVLDTKRGPCAIKAVIERTFRELDLDAAVVVRWRPFQRKASIVIDPHRAFGQPIAAASGIPTIALADAAWAEGSVERAARLYEVPASVVRDALRFEDDLSAP